MNQHDGEVLINTIKGLMEKGGKSAGGPASAEEEARLKKARRPEMSTEPSLESFDDAAMERMYHAFKNRFIAEARIDPILLQLIVAQPELIVEVEPRICRLDGMAGAKGRIAKLIADGFFDTTKKGGSVRTELARTGSDPGGGGTLYNPLNDFVKEGFLTKEGDGFRIAPGVKVSTKELKVV